MRHQREPSRRPDEALPREEEPLAEHALLQLQRAVGNRAIGAMLARDTTTAEPADAKKEAAPSGPHVTVPDIGTIPLLSFSFAVPRNKPPSDRGPSEGKDKDKKDEDLPGGDIELMSEQGEHSTKLFKWSLDGQPKDLVIVVPRGSTTMRITLKGALIRSYSISGDGSKGGASTESWTVNCTAMKFETLEEAK